MGHPVVHFEIGGPDGAALDDFYAGLFGWGMTPVADAGYTLVDTHGGAGINGGIQQIADGNGWVTFYIQTDDLQTALDKINLLGGKTSTPITELPGMVTFAQFEDPDGLIVGLVLGPASSDPAAAQGPTSGSGAPVDWFELLGSDPDRSQRFYGEIFGWQSSEAGPGYRMIDTGVRQGINGGIGIGQAGNWATVYASVNDVEAVLAKAVELGGDRVYGPDAVDDHMQTGALRDPAGNVFGIYHHAPH